jgi:hypothetical protein
VVWGIEVVDRRQPPFVPHKRKAAGDITRESLMMIMRLMRMVVVWMMMMMVMRELVCNSGDGG